VLLLDGGDVGGGYGRQAELKFETAMKAMGKMGYIATAVGEKDLLLGPDYLKYVSDFSGVPVVSANIVGHSGAPVFPRFIMTRPGAICDNITAAAIGVISTEFKDEIEAISPGVVIEEYDAILEELIAELRPQADILVLLAHAAEDEARSIAKNFPDIDLIIASHVGDDPMPTPMIEGDVPIVFAGTKGMHVGVAKMILGNRDATLESYRAEKLDGEIQDSPRMLTLLEDYQQMLAAERLLESYPRTSHDEAEFVGEEPCRRCHSLSTSRFNKSKHAHGFDALVEKNHSRDPECVGCHTVGFGYKSGFISSDETPQLMHVGCESCHGPAAEHVKEPLEKEYGAVERTTCEACHNSENSPDFVYEERLEEIQHDSFFLCSARICHWLD
jgi:hypothetical protein